MEVTKPIGILERLVGFTARPLVSVRLGTI
jgi:hypothetical protein